MKLLLCTTVSVVFGLALHACAPVDDAPASTEDPITVTPIGGPTLPTAAFYPVAITSFTPASAQQGAQITVQGTNLNRDRAGRLYPAGGALAPYRVSFVSGVGGRVSGSMRIVSATQIVVTVPAGAATGRVRLEDSVGVLAESPAVFTVLPVPPPPPPPTLARVVNNNQYDLVSLTLNGQLVANCASPLPPGTSRDFPIAAGNVTARAVLGLCATGTAVSPVALERMLTAAAGQTVTFTVDPSTLGELLTNWGQNSGEWATGLFLEQGQFHQLTLRYDLNARWTLFDQGAATAQSGQSQVVSWPTRATCVRFRVAPNLPDTQTCLPFSGFTQNGLASTPLNFVRR